jgi:hypothetical protein
MFFAMGCSSTEVPATRDAGGTDCLACGDSAMNVSLLLQVRGVLDQVCASSDGCHGAAAGNLAISSGAEFTPLIQVRSTEVPSLYRVKPGDPAQSYLYMKLACDGGPIVQACMPKGGHLNPTTVQAFHDWIEAGAPTH